MNSRSRWGRNLAALLISTPFALVSCAGGFFGGTLVAMRLETANGGRTVVQDGQPFPSRFCVLVRNTVSQDIAIEFRGPEGLQNLIRDVSKDENLTFLMPGPNGRIEATPPKTGTTKESGRVSAGYDAVRENNGTQTIRVTWDEHDDLSGISTYVASNKEVIPKRYGLVHPGLMGHGFIAAIALVVAFKIIGWALGKVSHAT